MGALDFSLPLLEKCMFERIDVQMDQKLFNTLWVTMKKEKVQQVQNFSLPLLRDLHAMVYMLKENDGCWTTDENMVPVHYAVMKSEHPEYFNLGGDLKHFRECIRKKDGKALYEYSKLCLDIMYDWAISSSGSLTTIALVQGRALGGGFEAALSADFLIAEEQSTFGFPEIMFGLFPCTGGMSLLARRVGVHQAERMMTNARIYSASELKEMGIVDEVCPSGEGNLAVEKFIKSHSKRRLAREALQRGRHRLAPLDYAELHTVVNEWVDLALRLTDEELRMMDMLIMMQHGSQKPSVAVA
jgi:DSF synthase